MEYPQKSANETRNPLIIAGVDPGLTVTGVGIIRVDGSRLQHLGGFAIRPLSRAALGKRLCSICDALIDYFCQYKPHAVAIENLFHHNNFRSVLQLGQARGMIFLAAERCGIPTFEYTPAEVKQAVVGYGRATKEQIGFMISRMLDCPVPDVNDISDALAIAVCHANSRRMMNRLEISQ